MTRMLNHILETKGLAEAYNAACERLRENEAHLNELWASRFFEMRTLENGTKRLWPVTAEYVSRSYDLSDSAPVPQFHYCDETGVLQLVKLASTAPSDPLCGEQAGTVAVWGAAHLIANGQVVGQVLYTDH